MSTAWRLALAAGEKRGAAHSQQHILRECWAGCSDQAQASQLLAEVALFEHITAAYPNMVTNTQETATTLWHRKGQRTAQQIDKKCVHMKAKEKIQQN